MRHLFYLLLFLITSGSSCFSQCIGKEKIKFGGDYGFINYIHLCPSYSFSDRGDTSKKWNILNDPIDIKQAPKAALTYKKKVEDAILQYTGSEFYSDLRFQSVDVVYPKELKAFRDAGRKEVTLRYYKAKYFYYYQFKPDSVAVYLIGIAVSKDGRILSPFVFPSKKDYMPVDKHTTYCRLIDIAKKRIVIEPIESLSLEFDTKSKRLLWLISQAVSNSHEGRNYINQVMIDAADLSKVEQSKTYVNIVY